jgi:fatty-acid desaturase
MLIVDAVLFGPLGVTIWAVQMMWIPITAAGIVNGIGITGAIATSHAKDASRNIVPWGIPDRRRRAAQQPSRLRHVGEAVVAVV